MSGRFGNRWRYRNRVRYARGRYSGRRVGAARRARGNARAANQQNDVSNVTINMMKKIKTGVTGLKISNEFKEIGTCAINIFDILQKSEFYQSYSNMYDQFRINRIQVKVTPITWQTYNQFNIPTATMEEDEQVTGANPAYPNGPATDTYGAPVEGYGSNSKNYIVPQALTIVTAWDRTGLDDTQIVETTNNTQRVVYTTIGDAITTYSSAKSTQLVAGANFNCVRYLYPSSQQEKSLYFSTNDLVDQIVKYEANDNDVYKKWYVMKPVAADKYKSTYITNLHSDPNCPFKPTFLIGVLKVDDLLPAASPNDVVPEKCTGQIYPVTFNLEFDIGVTFRGLRKTQIV